ncbi:MAG: recombinase family protein [Bdellovibrionia bacterium]
MTQGLIAEPLWLDFEAEITGESDVLFDDVNPLTSKQEVLLPVVDLTAKIEQLLRSEKYSLEQVAQEVGISLTTVRRIGRTLGLGRHSLAAQQAGALFSCSSQTPFGWTVEQGVLREAPEEMKWVHLAKEMRAVGKSFRGIARFFTEKGVPIKNGGRWHGKTVIQILNFNARVSGQKRQSEG